MSTTLYPDSDVPPWLRSLLRWTWTRREQLALPVGGVVAVAAVGFALYLRFAPTDLELAEADVNRAWTIHRRLESDAHRSLKDANSAADLAAHYRKTISADKDTHDRTWLRWQEAYRDGSAQLYSDHLKRRNTLLTLSAHHLPLLVEAEQEVIRGRTARDQGHPIKVSPRVREILAPILATP